MKDYYLKLAIFATNVKEATDVVRPAVEKRY